MLCFRVALVELKSSQVTDPVPEYTRKTKQSVQNFKTARNGPHASPLDPSGIYNRKSLKVYEQDRTKNTTETTKRQSILEMDYRELITIEPGKRSGKPCIRGMRITVADVLDCLAGGMSYEDVLSDFPELTLEDIRACLAFAADCERRLFAKKVPET